MIKIFLVAAWKEILIFLSLSVVIFILNSGISISFNPFRISLKDPCFGIGVTLMVIGLVCCLASAYNSGLERGNYYKGYKKGFSEGVDYVVDWAKEKEKEGGEQ